LFLFIVYNKNLVRNDLMIILKFAITFLPSCRIDIGRYAISKPEDATMSVNLQYICSSEILVEQTLQTRSAHNVKLSSVSFELTLISSRLYFCTECWWGRVNWSWKFPLEIVNADVSLHSLIQSTYRRENPKRCVTSHYRRRS